MITLLVIAGIVILIAIGYMNHVVENNKLEKKRTEIELNDRLRRCGEITETFPGQLMTPALKLLLARLELNVNQRLLNLNKTSAPLKARITELNTLVAQGESIPVNNPPAPIQTEAKAKDVRFLLEALHGQVTRAAQDGFLPTNEAKHWIKESAISWCCCTSSSSTTSASTPCSRASLARRAWPSNVACSTCASSLNRCSTVHSCNCWKVNWPAPTRPSWLTANRRRRKSTN